VYHSVNGDLSCLRDHYSVRGLEHCVQSLAPLQLQLNQKNLVAAVMAEQARQKQSGIVDPEALQQQATMRTTEAFLQALKRAQLDATEAASAGSSHNDPDSEDDEDDDEDDGAESQSISSKAENGSESSQEKNACSSEPTKRFGKPTTVDIVSLRDMNMVLLDQMRSKSNARALPRALPRINGESSLITNEEFFQEFDKEFEQWDALYQRQRERRDSLSHRPTSLYRTASAAVVVTNRALQISDYRRDSLLTSIKTFSSCPSLLSLQSQGLPLQAKYKSTLGIKNKLDASATVPLRSLLSGEEV
jgi:hypothetical protein